MAVSQTSNEKARTKRTFSRLNWATGERTICTPRSTGEAWVGSAFLPISISNPGKSLTKTPEGLQRLEVLHSKELVLRQSIPMGFAGAKLALTDLGVRCQLEAELDEAVRRKIPTGVIYRNPRSSIKKAVWVRGVTSYHALLEFVKTVKTRGDPTEVGWLQALEELLGVPLDPRHHYTRIHPYPLIKALNGDDNLGIEPARVGEGCQKHLQANGQGVEDTKTSSSVYYMSYCQKHGRNPISQIVAILVAEAQNCADPSSPHCGKWRYAADQGRTYLLLEKPRARLFTQAFKGSDATLKGEGRDTARAGALTRTLPWMVPGDRLLTQMLFAEAFPEQYKTAPVEAFLPEAFGGTEYPHVFKTSDILSVLRPEHRYGIHRALFGTPMEVVTAKYQLRRSPYVHAGVPTKVKDSVEGLKVLSMLNAALVEEGLKPIKVFSFSDAHLEALGRLSEVSQKERTPHSTPGHSNATTTTSFISNAEKVMMHRLFAPLSSVSKELESMRIIPQLLQGSLKEAASRNPRMELASSIKRITSYFRGPYEEHGEAPAVTIPMNLWNMSAVRDKHAQIFIRREDMDTLRHPALLSLRMLPGYLHGEATQTIPKATLKPKMVSTKLAETTFRPTDLRIVPPRLRETGGEATSPVLHALILQEARQAELEEEEEEQDQDATEGASEADDYEIEVEPVPEDTFTRRWADMED